MNTPTLHTPRFILRRLGPQDVAALYPTFADDEAMRYWSRPPVTSREELAAWLLDDGWDGRAWVAVPREGGPAVGRFVSGPEGEGIEEIGYLVVKERHGQGVARECLSALITHLFAGENHRRLYADIDPDNAASNRLVESLGFTLEGRLRATWDTHIGVRDSLIWGLLRHEWPREERTT